MSGLDLTTDAYGGWAGCVHCGQALPHEGTGWSESSRCRLFQRIAEQAWDEGYLRAVEPASDIRDNPYRAAQVACVDPSPSDGGSTDPEVRQSADRTSAPSRVPGEEG